MCHLRSAFFATGTHHAVTPALLCPVHASLHAAAVPRAVTRLAPSERPRPEGRPAVRADVRWPSRPLPRSARPWPRTLFATGSRISQNFPRIFRESQTTPRARAPTHAASTEAWCVLHQSLVRDPLKLSA